MVQCLTVTRNRKKAISIALKLFRSCPCEGMVRLDLDRAELSNYGVDEIMSELQHAIFACGHEFLALAIGDESHKALSAFSTKCAKVLNALVNDSELKRV